jgi:hypothetical protein
MFDDDKFKFYLILNWNISSICNINKAFGIKEYSINEINDILCNFKIILK